MTTTASRIDESVAHRLLESSRTLSFDPTTEVDWDAPLDPEQHGLSPEWSSLYGTPLWDRMTPQQQVTLTRHEACSVMSTGIWFEMILQQMVLRELYASDPTRSEFMFGLTEIADECRHSIMFARAMQAMDVPAYGPSKLAVELARGYKTLATGESAYGGILVAEEVLDIYQRDLMRDERVLPVIRTTSRIHVVEESRHMTFAREEMKVALEGASAARRLASGTLIAIVASVIVGNLVHPKVYAAAGLDVREAVAAAQDNPHHAAMLRTSSAHLMEFLDECGLVGGPARRIYTRLHLL